MSEKYPNPKFPAPLRRRTLFLNKSSKSTTPTERIAELIRDEAWLYKIFNNAITNKKIPKVIDLAKATPQELDQELVKFTLFKHELENDIIDCVNHVTYLTQKLSDLRSATPTSLPGVSSVTLSSFITKLKDYQNLFTRLRTTGKMKVSMVNDILSLLKTLKSPRKTYEQRI
jgi:hypothetical protein